MAKTANFRRAGPESAREAPAAAGTADDPQALWELFRRSRSAKIRNLLVVRYMPLVRAISARIAAELPCSVDMEDLVSAGSFGLMDAIDRYDPTLGTRFETYCAVRIRGSILDELRHLNWMPRLQSARANKVGAAVQSLRGELGRTPTPHEIARETGLKVRDVRHACSASRSHVSLSGGRDENEQHKAVRGIDILEAEGLCDPAELLQEKERRDLLEREVRRLPKPERLLVMLYYFEELTMKQIGAVLNVTESRICQMHTDILSRLQQRLGELDESRSRPA